MVGLRIGDDEARFAIGPHCIEGFRNLIRPVIDPDQTGTAVIELQVVGALEIRGHMERLHFICVGRALLHARTSGPDAGNLGGIGQHPVMAAGEDEGRDNQPKLVPPDFVGLVGSHADECARGEPIDRDFNRNRARRLKAQKPHAAICSCNHFGQRIRRDFRQRANSGTDRLSTGVRRNRQRFVARRKPEREHPHVRALENGTDGGAQRANRKRTLGQRARCVPIEHAQRKGGGVAKS